MNGAMRWSISMDALDVYYFGARDEPNVQIAFQYEVWLLNDVKAVANIQCDGCSLPISYEMQRFVCKNCDDGDAYGTCFKKREKHA
jgi:hypothetical protein